MSQAIEQPAVPKLPGLDLNFALRSYLPAILTVAASICMVLVRIQVGGDNFPSDGALMMVSLACYLTAACFILMNLYAPSSMAQRVGLWLTTGGVFFNLSSWAVRWVAAHDREIAILLKNGHSINDMPWAFRYIPFANLYDLSIAFAFGAGITTLLIARRPNFRFLGALTLPLASLILVLARFIGNEFVDLPPILDSYWRPIHVGIASLSYGVALVCFAVAVVYLLKDGVKTEAMSIWTSIFSIAVIGTISKFSVLTTGTYNSMPFVGGSRQSLPLRVDLPWVGPLLVVSAVLLVGVIITFGKYLSSNDEKARSIGHWLLRLSLVSQAAAVAMYVSQVKTLTNLVSHIQPKQYLVFGQWMAEQQGLPPEQIAQIGPSVLAQEAVRWVGQRGAELVLSLNANPVELAAIITGAAGTLFVILFSIRTEKLKEVLPPLEKLDSLMYKTGSVAFAMLAMLLITGAIWANESWGRYWGWDSKETGALVAWLTYGAFLHSRIARGWTGRRSAYFALVGFLLVIFTYLGVSYLIPGLHSYA
jgi:cytochrome c-type biogenesis protein CcsB